MTKPLRVQLDQTTVRLAAVTARMKALRAALYDMGESQEYAPKAKYRKLWERVLPLLAPIPEERP